MKVWCYLFLLTIIMCNEWQLAKSTCVLESDFGVIVNCAFKKSTLFRIRNLGGVKAHISVGLSIGDELGFKESLTNVQEQDLRRSVKGGKLDAQIVQAQNAYNKNKKTALEDAGTRTSHSKNSQQNYIVVRSPNEVSSEEPPVTSQSLQKFAQLFTSSPKPSSKRAPTTEDTLINTIPPFKPLPAYPEASEVMKIATQTFSKGNSKPIKRLSSKTESSNSINNTSAGSTNTSRNTSTTDFRTTTPINDLLNNSNNTEHNSTTTTTTSSPVLSKETISVSRNSSRRSNYSSLLKVANAPKEFYPTGYDRHFKDDFASKVKLPKSSFQCRSQKFFPGLYADENLGCMVFHVCVLMERKFVTKSYLCPESTLFDQSILKCNWWFYVDCEKAKDQYDVNYSLARSFQLMKSLAQISRNRTLQEITTKSDGKD